jgi:tetratricopeptide (TPR) repeat protein
MFRAVLCVAAVLLTLGVAPMSAAADDGATCLDWRNSEEAFAACSRLISHEPNVADHYYSRGFAYYRRDPDRAIADFDQVIRLDPKHFFSYVHRGDAYRLKHDYDRAIADYDKAIEVVGFKGDSPKSFRGGLEGDRDRSLHFAYTARGHAYKDKGDYDRAIADYDKAIRLNPYWEEYTDRGIAYLIGKHDYDRAIADFNQAIRLERKYVAAYDGRGLAYSEKGDYNRAIGDFDQAIQLNPSYVNPYSHRGYAYGKKGDFDRAMADLNKALTLDPKYARGYANRGAILEQHGELAHAIADYDQAIQLDPNDAIAREGHERVQALVTPKLPAAASAQAQLPPQTSPPHAADDRETCGRRQNEEGVAACGRLIKRNPSDGEAYLMRGHHYSRKGDYDHAIADYSHVIELDYGDYIAPGGAYQFRAQAYAAKHDYDHAIADYSQFIARNAGYPNNNGALEERAKAYEAKADYDHAIADYEQLLKLDPNDALARQGRERIQTVLAARPNPAPAQTQFAPQTSPPQPATVTVPAERRVALVIGNSGYTSSLVQALPNPRRDAKVVADALRQAGFDTVELVDLDRIGMAKALQAFRAKAASADWALVYFAGHGIEINRVNYLIPVDAKLADSGDVELETVSYEAVLNSVGGAKALRIIILDACRNNPFKAQMHQTMALRGSLDRGLAAPPEAKPGTLVVYSAKEGQAAVDGDGINSPFALAFVGRLKKPGREVQRMFDDVRDDVLQATNERQEPYKYGSLPGSRDFFFVAGK